MKKFFSFIIITFLIIITSSCKKNNELTYKNDIYYSIFVRSFADSDGDGIGDLNGITENLDYLEELGVTGIWLLPIFKSNSYHGYDVIDYLSIEPDYGSMEDLEKLIKEAKKRNINIILDLVINHTSDLHPWYLKAKDSKESEYRDYYVWNNGTAYESFPGGMKDLNLSNPKVVDEIYKIAKFYLDKGVQGFRLDAVGHFFEESGIHLSTPKNILFMNEFKNYVKNIKKDAFIVGEVFVNDYNLLSKYVQTDVSYFNFYLQNEILSKVGLGNNRQTLSTIIENNYKKYYEINPDYVDSPFLGNHDLDRVASTYDPNKLKQAYDILLTLPGNPFIYYGDELGMKGKRYEGEEIHGRIVYDEYRRQPFLWGDKRETKWLLSDGSNVNVKSYEEQKMDDNSLYNHVKKIIKLRKDNPALFEGKEIYKYDKINQAQSYIRIVDEGEFKQALLVVHNLYDKKIKVDLDLELIYGDMNIKPNSMSIFEIPYQKIGEFIDVYN